MNFQQLYNLTGARVKQLASRTQILGIYSRTNAKRFSFFVRSDMPYSDPSGHVTSILYPKLDYKNPRVGSSPILEPILVKCTDPSFLYWGTEYYASQYGYHIDGNTEKRAPDIRDPHGERWLCKHLARVFLYIKNFNFTQLIKKFRRGGGLRQASVEKDLIPSIEKYMKFRKFSQDQIERVLSIVTEENAEEVMESLGMLVQEKMHLLDGEFES